MGPITKKKKNTNKQKLKEKAGREIIRPAVEIKIFYFFYFQNFLSQIHEFLTVRIRRDKHGKCSKRRGLRMNTRNRRFHREFR